MILQQNIAQSFHSPVVRVLLVAIAIGLLYVLWREVRKIPAKLFTLMATAFVDMLGLLMILPLLPFYVQTLGGRASIYSEALWHRHYHGLHRCLLHARATVERADLGPLF